MVYNVKVLGVSIGMTRSLKEAITWKEQSANSAQCEICFVRDEVGPGYKSVA